MTKRVVLAVDTNTASEPVKVAGDLAELTGADVLVMHCDELHTVFGTGIWLHDDTEPRTAIGDACTQLRDRGIKARGVTVCTDSPEKTAEAIVHQGLDPAVDILVLRLLKVHHVVSARHRLLFAEPSGSRQGAVSSTRCHNCACGPLAVTARLRGHHPGDQHRGQRPDDGQANRRPGAGACSHTAWPA